MDLFITNLDSKVPKGKLQELLTPILLRFQIHVFDVHKAVGKTFATLTIADLSKAQRVLASASSDSSFFCSPSGRAASFQVSRKPVDEFKLRVLYKEEKDRQNVKAWQKAANQASKSNDAGQEHALNLSTLRCGRWETKAGAIAFEPYFEIRGEGHLRREGRTLIIRSSNGVDKAYELIIDHSDIYSMAIGSEKRLSTLTVTLLVAPRLFEERIGASAVDDISLAFANVHIGPQPPTKVRISTLPGMNPLVAGSCLTYSMAFSTKISGLQNRIRSMTSQQVPVTILHTKAGIAPSLGNYTDQLARLNAQMAQLKCSFAWRFQLQALWANGLLSPTEVLQLLPSMLKLRSRLGEPALLKALQRLALQLPPIDATTNAREGGLKEVESAMAQQSSFLFEEDHIPDSNRGEVLVHRVTVTPCGYYLSGPEICAGNRVLRQYRDHSDCFLRVSFSDENGDRIEFDRSYSNERIFEGRFLSVLQKGLDIADKHFDFLGFSHSSLRAQTCWFMRPFVHEESLLFSAKLISMLGDFSEIRCPAKCAARIGQAFSETTVAVKIDPDIVRQREDVKVGQYFFTDGCGTMSTLTWRLLKGNSSKRDQPTSYQIRYKGAKGMLTLDTALQGHRIILRKSMVKFTGSPSDELEICGTNARPLPFKLNRQIIKILEDLKVPASAFMKLQEQAIKRLSLSASSRSGAVDFIIRQLSDGSSGLPRLLKHLRHLGVDLTDDDFLRDVLGALLQIQLREIKYRSRILVPDAFTLYGISDETAWLEEGQVFVTWLEEDSKRDVCLNGRVAVTRSPALHPGDIQLVEAVAPPQESPLWSLHNCIVFSQKGTRDLPSMLSGGDLDGDLYNIIFDDDLIPKSTAAPAAYVPAQALDILRPVNVEDMTSFFVDFMQNDQLPRIATLHQVMADRDPEGTFSSNCLALAELHSTAFDFSKSGIKVDIKKIPRTPENRPDFMCPVASVKVEKGVKREQDQNQNQPQSRQRYRYYESDRVLGKLYRAVDEDIFFEDLEDDASSLFSKEASNSVLKEVLQWVRTHVDNSRIKEHLHTAREVREYYELNMLEIMSGYAVRRTEDLTEKEVFIGTILGRSGAASKFQREQSDYMKTRFNRDLRDIRKWMENQTTDGDDGYGFMILAVACLYVAVKEKSKLDATLSSFGWFAAGMCVPELVKEQEGSVFSV